MSVALAAEPQLVHAIPGRVRVHLPGWSGQGQRALETRLRRLQGVMSAQANSLTANVLIRFDPAILDAGSILAALRSLLSDVTGLERDESPPPHAVHEREGHLGRARITVRGLDRHPEFARFIVEHLGSRPGVKRVTASALTGRVLIEFSHHDTMLEDLLSEIAHVELPDVAGEDRPEHPLDPGPLLQSAARVIGASAGLALLAAKQLTGFQESAGLRTGAVRASAALGILQGFPFIRNGLRRLLGRTTADLLFYVPNVVVLTLAGSPLGLALGLAESLRLLTEVIPRRAAWRQYEEGLENVPVAHPGAVIRLESGARTPLNCTVIEGFGTCTGRHGLPEPVAPNETLPAGARLYGGPFVLELQGGEPFAPEGRSASTTPSFYDRYLSRLGPLSLGYAALTAILTRSWSRTFQAFLLVNPRTAMIGKEAADTGASARVLREGVTVVGTRPERPIALPNLVLLDGPRVLSDGFEVTDAIPLETGGDVAEIHSYAEGVAAAAGAPWGGAVVTTGGMSAVDGTFDGRRASAEIDGARYTLGPLSDWSELPAAVRARFHGEHLLVLCRESKDIPTPHLLGVLALRPRLAAGIADLVDACRRHGVEIGLLSAGHPVAAEAMSRRTQISLLPDVDTLQAVRSRQEDGSLVALVSDSAHAAAAFNVCDLAIALTTGRTSHFPARADLLAPDIRAVASIVEAGARRETAVRDSVLLSIGANIFGAFWGIRGAPGILRASYGVYVTALGALTDAWARLRGGERPGSSIARLVDPRPERWGRRSVSEVLRSLKTNESGLTSAEAAQRYQAERPAAQRNGIMGAILDQIRSPLTAILAAGATLSVVLGSTADVVMIAATIAANVAVGAWQERQTGHAIAALERIGTSSARVLRDGRPMTVAATRIVPGDVLVLAPGDRVAADARLLSAQGLEVDEAALTGESLPVTKQVSGGTDASHVVLAGSDVTVGTGLAVVFAVGRRTRMGATAAALALDEMRTSPLGVRLSRMLRQVLPVAAAGGVVVLLSGLLRGRQLLSQLAIGASIAIAAVPEGLPLLAGVGEAAVARRLAGRSALVRRLSAVEALGRVDVACTDKTGTLTEGRLALRVVANLEREAPPAGGLPEDLHRVLVTAGLATPHPDAADATAHPTDVAVAKGVRTAGFGEELHVERDAELPFDPARSFHAALVRDRPGQGQRLCLKGAEEALIPRCDRVRCDGEERTLDEAGRDELLARAHQLAERGLRVLMVAEGAPDTSLDDPQGLVALGFVGIADPLRPEVPAAVQRCHDAGVRVIMLTGDHPATARAIAWEAGLLGPGDTVLTGADIVELQNGDLDERLDRATVIARVTPLDKLRIVESLQRRGHTLAMTGDGVNDAPALRLADVGVAMGRGGTEVARQAADVVLADDNFSTLVEALVEGRSFWRNIRRALALLLGGNLGELGLVAGASAMGLASPLLTRQILAVNLVTDVLPSLAVALQPPEDRNLAGLAREGTAALDAPLRRDVRRRGTGTAVPSLAAFLIALRSGGLPEARSVAFASVVATQLAQTLDVGRTEHSLTRSVFSAVAGSAGVLVATLTLPPLQRFLALVTPSPFGWALIGAASLTAVLVGRGLSSLSISSPRLRLLPAPVPV